MDFRFCVSLNCVLLPAYRGRNSIEEIRSLKRGIEERLSKKFRNKGTLPRLESDKLN